MAAIKNELHAAAIRSAVTALNDAIGAAWQDGLIVEVDILRLMQMQRADSLPAVTARISEPI